MKNLLFTLFLLFGLSVYSQDTKQIIKYNDGYQKGYHILVDGEWKSHGIWRRDYGRAKYDKGELVWIKLNNKRKWTGQEIKMVQMERKIKRLESQLVSN